MSAEWKTYRLEQLDIIFEDGDRSSRYPKASEYLKCGKHPFINTRNIVNNQLDWTDVNFIPDEKFSSISKGRVSPSDILISTRGSKLGKTAYYTFHPWKQPLINAQLLIIRCNDEKVEAKYLWHLLSSAEGQQQINSLKSGSAQPQLPVRDLKKFEVTLPSRELQRMVVTVMDSIDEKSSLNTKINQTLEQMAQAIFKSWFVDFEPVRAKMNVLEAGGSEQDALLAAMQAISGKDADQLVLFQTEQPEQYAELKTTAELFPSAMQDSELGEIPEGWEVLPLSKMINLIGGGTPKKSEPSYWDGSICWFSVKDAPSEGNIFVIDTEEKITDAGLKGSSTKLLPIGTTIITARGTVGKLALTGVVTAMNQSCYGVVGNDGTGPYLNYLRLHKAVDTLKRNTHGAVFDTITRATFETVVQPQACLELRQRFEEVVEPIFKTIKTSLHQIQTLSELRDPLLPKLLSGELTFEPSEDNEVAIA